LIRQKDHPAIKKTYYENQINVTMNSEELKKLQSPIKAKYQKDPDAALITLRAEGRLGEGISCKIETGRRLAEAGLHPATGGEGILACSGDMLLESLVACAGVTLSAVATSMGIKIEAGNVKAEGDLDMRGTLAVEKDIQVGFKSIRLLFELICNENDDRIQTLLKLTKRYCIVYQTIISGTEVDTRIKKINS
jgi:uncharacterized OsmC-like protein